MLFKRGIMYLLLSYNSSNRNSLKAQVPQDLLYGLISISLYKYATPILLVFVSQQSEFAFLVHQLRLALDMEVLCIGNESCDYIAFAVYTATLFAMFMNLSLHNGISNIPTAL